MLKLVFKGIKSNLIKETRKNNILYSRELFKPK